MIRARDAWLLAVAILLPLAVLRWQSAQHAQQLRPSSRGNLEAGTPLASPRLAGTCPLEDGTWLHVRLAAWRSDSTRQAFESAALARRWGLDPAGTLHLLELERSALEGAQVPSALEVSQVEVVDSQGTCMHSLALLPSDPAQVQDPFRTLASAGEGALAPGGRARCLLWGSLPGPGAQVRLPLAVDLQP